MTRAALVVSVGVLFLGACGGDADEAADTSAASTTAPSSEPLVIRTSLVIAATAGSEPIATGEVIEGATLGDLPFCIDGTILDSHKSPDAAAEPYGPVCRTMTCRPVRWRWASRPTSPRTSRRLARGRSSAEPARSKRCAGAERWRPFTAATSAAVRETLTGTVTR